MSLDGRPLVVVANRLPVSKSGDAWRPSAGGLVTALRPVVEQVDGHWVGWDGGDPNVPKRVDGFAADLHPVAMTAEEVDDHYYGFSNRTLWPLFHDLLAEPVFDREWWRTYERMNIRFADAAAAVEVDDPVYWVHDYHLLLAPALLRDRKPDATIGFFLHIPFPPPELMGRLPWNDELLDGLLGADAIGFHTEWYRENFVRSVRRSRRDVTVSGDMVHLPDGRSVRTAAHPISIDVDEFSALAVADETEQELAELREQFANRKVMLGVDRLDYTKGIRHRLQAIERLLTDRPELRTSFAFIQIAVPSRDDVEEYRDLREQVEYMVGHIHGRFTEPGHDVPVHYLYRSVPKTRLAAYYRLADVMAITPLKDGMNLVAKEFVTVQDAARDRPDQDAGVLLLSEFTGAALEFVDDAVMCNPFDVQSLAARMAQSLTFDADDRRSRIARMAASVREGDVFAWVNEELESVTMAERARAEVGP
ncbi:alpha,alpha-trehalose-phosphate synthase (UDP-forming) [Salsipaludibacter albus]|uniref:alpha,alpha-trehalose-phosphate synthase (UDP-forming) n=1 Tax=Salsipaludibacter albus TaxID=2849650 RepID=UPI001EE4A22C|nr:trehalose-6-phosphate synthase [Salsipaludibacter albus]MBY5163928.1 trehalose-6-phosphate synthase [Salsipaludibacter albus]